MASPVLDSVGNEGTACAGLPGDTYDRYVLGLLDKSERAHVERELEQQCPACIAGVQRSISLWLVFAGSLEQVEPAADFRARLVRIADLSNRVLTVPKRYKRVREPAILISSLTIISLILAVLLYFTFLAGKEKARRDLWLTRDALAKKQDELISEQVQLQQERGESQIPIGKRAPGSDSHLREEMAKAIKQNQQYEAKIAGWEAERTREMQKAKDNSTLVSALENPGVRLLTFKNATGSASSAYAFVIENSKIVFVASNLPVLAEQHQYVLWLVRKTDHRFVSLKVFAVNSEGPTLITLDNQDEELIKDLAGLMVTDEPSSEATIPSAVRLLETPGAAAVPTPVTASSPPAERL